MVCHPFILILILLCLLSPVPLKSEETSDHLDQHVYLDINQKVWPMNLSAQIEIPASSKAVWEVLTDYDHLADFLPQIEKSHVLGRVGDRVILEQITRTQFLFFRKKIELKLSLLEKDSEEIIFFKTEGNMETFSGKWTLIKIDGGRSTRLIYQLKFKPSFYVPKWVIRHALDHEIPVQLRLISQRAETVNSK
jgi:carbon monoxide dehydrogenase subunit G